MLASNDKYSNCRGDYQALIQLILTPRIGNVRIRALLLLAADYSVGLDELINSGKYSNKLITADQLNRYNANISQAQKLLDSLWSKQINLLTANNNRYPKQLGVLGEQYPPYLFVKGNINILHKKGAGFCGARKASQKGLDTAYDCACQIADLGYNVVSGYANGVDMHAHKGALKTGGTTTIVLVDGILNFKIKKEIADDWDWERVVVLSEFPPMIPWKAHNAMQRNKTICGLSDAMLIIEAAARGGSIAAARACLDLNIPLFAPVYQGNPETAQGNSEMLQRGARPIKKNLSINKANLYDLCEVLKKARPDNRLDVINKEQMLFTKPSSS